MRAEKRVQLNMFLKKIEGFDYLASVSEGLFPILWMEEVSNCIKCVMRSVIR